MTNPYPNAETREFMLTIQNDEGIYRNIMDNLGEQVSDDGDEADADSILHNLAHGLLASILEDLCSAEFNTAFGERIVDLYMQAVDLDEAAEYYRADVEQMIEEMQAGCD